MNSVDAIEQQGDVRGTTSSQGRSLLATLAFYIALALAFRIVLFEAFEIEGPSMEPTLLNGDRVVVAKFSYGLFLPFTDHALLTWGKPTVGDVVIVKSPQDNIDIVKRVVGVAGEVVEFRDGVVFRNGVPLAVGAPSRCQDSATEHWDNGCTWVREKLDDSRYSVSMSSASPKTNSVPVKVPEGFVYILGDHRDRSNDSRFFGPVPINRIKGKGLVIYWSKDTTGYRWSRMFKSIR